MLAFLAFGGCLLVVSAILLRRKPMTAVAVTLGLTLFARVTPLYRQPGLLALLVGVAGIEVCVIAATRRRSVSVTAAAAVVVGVLYLWLLAHADYGHGATLMALALLTIIAWLIGYSIRQAQVQRQLRRAQAAAQAVTAERLRIARELHDMVAHSIGIIAIQAGAGHRIIDSRPADARDALAAIEATSRETLAGLRRMVAGLRRADEGHEPGQIPLDPAPGLADVDRLAATTLDAGVRVDVQWQGDRRPLPADIDLSAFRIIQEAVTNVVRHAGVGQCRVCIDQQQQQISIEVVDSGRGGLAADSGYGIVGMRERAVLLGGEFAAGPRPGGGFRVAARLPVPAA
jgi:signal transduction histidine kinase